MTTERPLPPSPEKKQIIEASLENKNHPLKSFFDYWANESGDPFVRSSSNSEINAKVKQRTGATGKIYNVRETLQSSRYPEVFSTLIKNESFMNYISNDLTAQKITPNDFERLGYKTFSSTLEKEDEDIAEKVMNAIKNFCDSQIDLISPKFKGPGEPAPRSDLIVNTLNNLRQILWKHYNSGE
jgi:hypothetical protein